MHFGPPTIPHPDPGVPPSSGSRAYLWWLLRRQGVRALTLATLTSATFVAMAAPAFFIAGAVDAGLRGRDWNALAWWSAGLGGIGLLVAALIVAQQAYMAWMQVDAAYRTVEVLTRQVARLGATLSRKVSAGEIAAIGAADLRAVSEAMAVAGQGVAGVVFLLVMAGVLFAISPLLGTVVMLGMPLVALAVGPLMSRLQQRGAGYRSRQGKLTVLAADIVAGLRVLRGVGGEERFEQRYRDRSQRLVRDGYRFGAVTSWVWGLQTGLPGLFLALVTWLGARQAHAGEITVGELVAVYGYAAAMTMPIGWSINSIRHVVAGLVAARRVVDVLALEPELAEPANPRPGTTEAADLRDPESGLTVPPGRLTVIAGVDANAARTVLDRLARFVDSEATWGGVRLSEFSTSELRRRILSADHDAYLFAGTLAQLLSGAEDKTRDELEAAVRAAAAEDVVDGLEDGIDSEVGNQVRTLSGGQRQRVRLARALAADPEVLLASEPTSAVDAHTEDRIAQRLKERRAGRTTVVLSSSPLLLARADQAVWMEDGKAVASGRHEDLLRVNADYRRLVLRDSAETEEGRA